MTERQERELEQLKTLDDYLDLLKVLDETAGEVENPTPIDKVMLSVSKAMTKKVKYILSISKKYRQRQGFFSVMADKRQEKREKEAEEPSKPSPWQRMKESVANLKETKALADKGNEELPVVATQGAAQAAQVMDEQQADVIENDEVIENTDTSPAPAEAADDVMDF